MRLNITSVLSFTTRDASPPRIYVFTGSISTRSTWSVTWLTATPRIRPLLWNIILIVWVCSVSQSDRTVLRIMYVNTVLTADALPCTG